ncbi:MAG: InlB B-repeat-containing protein [Acetatifactor sp.]|nr:InlB B-repeat-containing protein [Acetatifactor sp.]
MVKRFKAVLAIACMAFVFMIMNAKALAYTGTGTEENPYVIQKYQELVDLSRSIRQSGGEWWLKLGRGIQSDDKVNGDLQIVVGTVSKPVTMHLDLAGNYIMRIATTTDRGIFNICGGELIVDDSVGGGVIHSELSGGEISAVFTFPSHYEHNDQECVALTINGGKFIGNGGSVFDAANINGRITINGGVFNNKTQIERQPGEGTTDLYVNGGVFDELILNMKGKSLIKECEITRKLWVSSDSTLQNVIQSTSVVTVDDSPATSIPSQVIVGHIVITDPNKPRITQNLESYTFPYLGAEHAYALTVENAESGTWYVVDDENNRYTSDDIMEQGWADIEFKKSGNTHKMVFSNVTADLDGMKVYCKIKGGGYTITSDSAEIHVAKKVKDVSAEVTNLNKAVAGRSANAFTSVRLRDFCGRVAEYQSGSVQWFSADGTLFEGTLVKDAAMTLRISVDLTDGYEFADGVSCTVKNVKGSDLAATELAGQRTATHAVFEFTYVVPEAKDWNFARYGVKINNGMGLTVNDPLERPALNAEYSSTVTNWRPGKYVLLRPSMPSSDQELDHWDVTVQFAVMPTTSIGNTNSHVYSYEDTLSETFFSEIDPTKLSAGDQAAVKAACRSENCIVACVVSLTAVFRDKPVTCVVSFDANGAEGTMGNKQVRQFEKYLLPACKFTWTGHDFIGWTVGDGTEVYQPGNSINITGNVTLHAQWKLSTILIMVDLGPTEERKGEVTGARFSGTAGFYDYGSTVSLTAEPYTGYDFYCWKDGTEAVGWMPTYSFIAMEDRTLTPVFKDKTEVKIFFRANGGEGTMATQTIPYGTTYTLPECGFTLAGAMFIGWKIDGDDALHQPGENMEFVRDVTLVAQYQDEFIFVDENLAVAKKSLTLFDTITIDFKVPAEALADYHNPYLMVTQNGVETKLTDYREDGGLLIFSYRVAPHQMGDAVTAVPHALNADGRDVTGAEFTYSVAEYCYNMLNKEDYQTAAYAKLRRLLVDILLYGDAAQNYAGYKTNELVGANLTAAQRAMGTDVSTAMNYQSVKEPLFAAAEEGYALATIEKAALYLEAAVNIQFKYTANNLAGLRLVITDNEACTNVIGEYEADASQIDKNGLFYVNVSCLNAGEMRRTIYMTVMKGDQKVSNTYRYSIESYAASMKGKGGEKLDKLLDAMMRYGDSAAAYVGK